MHTVLLVLSYLMWGGAIAMFFIKNIKEDSAKEIDFKMLSLILSGTLCYIISCFTH